MIISADCETRGLDCREFVMGCLYLNSKKQEYFFKKEDMWNRIIELGKLELKKKRVLTIYMHNAQFDMYCFANLEDKNIKYFCLRPFIAKYVIEGRTAIKFLDSLGIFKMSLKELGDIIGKPKFETPNKYIEGLREQPITEQDKEYIKRDCEIVYDSIYMLKKKLEDSGIKIRGLYTTSQIAINYFMNKLREDEKNNDLFEDENKICLLKTRYKTHIHRAYRGGRVECFKTGIFENVNYLDCNNLYGYASINIKFPDLKTEKFEYNPLRNSNLNEILSKIGICKALVYNKENKLGLLPIRTDVGNYYPTEGKYLLGIWTNMELKEAIEEGYEIKDIEWTITWEEHNNPYLKITNELYKNRLNAKNSFEKLFYKEMQNFSYGKLAQNRATWELIIDSVELATKYIANNWKAIKGIGKENYMYEKEVKERDRNYYAPIIPTLINAWARVYMYKQMKLFDRKMLLYHDSVTGNMHTLIKENGLIKLKKFKELKENSKIETLCYNGNRTIWGKVNKIIKHKVNKKGYRIWFSNKRNLEVTEDHSLLVERMGKLINIKPNELNKKDIFKEALIENDNEEDTKDIEIRKWELIGFAVDDGCLKRNKYKKCYYLKLSTGIDKEEIIKRNILPLKENGIIRNYIECKDRLGDLDINGLDFIKELENIMYKDGDKKVNELVFSLNKRKQKAFIRGMMSADGTILTRQNSSIIRYTSIREDYIQLLSNLLNLNGIKNNWFIENNSNKYCGKSSNTFSIHLNIQDKEKFMNEIGFMIERKNKKYIISKSQKIPRKYKRIEEFWINDYVYDLEIENYHNFYANGILVHNTDSIMFQGDIPKGIIINKDIGMFKQLNKDDRAIIYGRKTYGIGREIKVSGFRNKNTTMEMFEKGNIENLRMETLKTTKDLKRVGGFKKEKRNLKEDNKRYLEVRKVLEEQQVYLDNNIKNINFFEEILRNIKPKDI